MKTGSVWKAPSPPNKLLCDGFYSAVDDVEADRCGCADLAEAECQESGGGVVACDCIVEDAVRVFGDLWSPATRWRITVAVAMALLASACGSGQREPTVWATGPGEVFEPTINSDDDEIIITFAVAPSSGPQICRSNGAVPVVVDLDEPIGDRRVDDGACPLALGTTSDGVIASELRIRQCSQLDHLTMTG